METLGQIYNSSIFNIYDTLPSSKKIRKSLSLLQGKNKMAISVLFAPIPDKREFIQKPLFSTF